MEALIADSHLFEEPLLRDPDKEVVSDLATDFGAPVIKKVLDLLRESTLFQMEVMVTLYSKSQFLFPGFFFLFLFLILNGTCYVDEPVRELYGQVL